MSKASGSYATHDRDSLPSFFGAQPQDLFPSPSQLGPPYHLTRVVGMDSSRSQPFHLPGQDVLTDMNLTPGGGDAPLRGIPKPWNILKFYDAGADDSPWVPPGIIVPDHRAGQGRHQNNPTALRDAFAPRYSEWRSPGPSECDTLPPGQLPSDSGYESRRTKQSIANASVFGDVDRGHETQSLTGRMDGFDPFEGMSSAPSYTGNSVNNHASMTEARGLSTLRTRGTAHSTVIICPDCGSHLKTKSELNKHKQRHSKPHKCDVSGCSRKEGFSTINDLDRHKRSVHRDTDTGGPRYRCHLAPCHNKKKIWPRADNFRSHLKRLHRVDAVDDDLAQYLIPFQQQDVGSLTEGMDVSDSTIESFRFTPYDQAMPPSMWQINEFLHTVPKAVLEKFLREEHNPLRIEPTQARITAQANPQHPCPGCPKSFQRRCDLKKHIKRHDKPYGCTFLNCYKSFGSKNDWKRHETSQHTQLEVWKCNERASNGVGTTCGKVFPRREDFKLHLQDTHNFRDVSALEAELHSCRIGRDCDLRYWCGFCEKIMGRSHTAMHPSTKRFDHIDDHFCGRNTAKRSISEWKHLETELSAAGSTPSSGNMETPKSSPDHQATARISPSNSGRLVSNCTLPGKRKSDDDSECPQSRRPRGQLATMWTCCNCTMQSSFRFNRACVSCPHSRCVDCQ
ncbi:Transcriptional regulator CRZ2 like protein [Verticillium longisporum]|nr:Transcriptional regulator CRZ2 like protein [Verticillium longisporum]